MLYLQRVRILFSALLRLMAVVAVAIELIQVLMVRGAMVEVVVVVVVQVVARQQEAGIHLALLQAKEVTAVLVQAT
jgi:hypothetical protein